MTRVAYDPDADNQRTGGGVMNISFSFNVNDTSSASQQLKTNVENVLADTENEIKADLNRLPDVSGESKKTPIPLYNNPSKQSELDAQHKAEMEYEEKSRLKAMTDKELENKIDAVNQKIDELGKNDFSAIQDKNGNVTSLAAAKARAEDEARSYGRTLSSSEIADIEDKYSKFELQNKQIEKANNDIEKYKNEQARRLAEEKASMDTSKQQLTTPSTTTQAINYESDKRFIPDYNKMSLDEKKELQEKLTIQNTDYFTKTGTYNESVSSQLEKLNSAIEKEELKKYSSNQSQLNPVIDKTGTENQMGDNITETEEVRLNTPTNWAKNYMDELERYQEKQKINQPEQADSSINTNTSELEDDTSIGLGPKFGADGWKAIHGATSVEEAQANVDKLLEEGANLYGTRTNELKAAMQELKVLGNKANITDLESKNNQSEQTDSSINTNTSKLEDDISIGLGPKFGTDGWKAIHGATSLEEAQANVDKLLE